jgi:hypothetical protein
MNTNAIESFDNLTDGKWRQISQSFVPPIFIKFKGLVEGFARKLLLISGLKLKK